MTTHTTLHGIVHTSSADNGPYRWSAIHDDYDGASSYAYGAVGYGHTEAEAIADLLAQLDDEDMRDDMARADSHDA